MCYNHAFGGLSASIPTFTTGSFAILPESQIDICLVAASRIPFQARPIAIRTDDGIGLPPDYEARGHGFRNIRVDAERMGDGTTVACAVPYQAATGGSR